MVFYDETGSGNPSGSPGLPLVQVTAGGITASTSMGSGRAVLAGVPSGPQTVVVSPETLPPFFLVPGPRAVQVPATADVLMPSTLPIGDNLPATYMAFGDSITDGDGSSDGGGYRDRLERMVTGYFGGGVVVNEGVGGSQSRFGFRRLEETLGRVRPAYTLIQYGTNDWSNPQCAVGTADPPCPTVNNLRLMVRQVRASQSLPFLATVIPTDPGSMPPERNQWVAGLDERIRSAAREEGAVLVDLERAFLAVGDAGRLYADSLHPNDAGYEVMAQAFFGAIAHGTAPPAPSALALSPIVPDGPDFVPGWSRPRR